MDRVNEISLSLLAIREISVVSPLVNLANRKVRSRPARPSISILSQELVTIHRHRRKGGVSVDALQSGIEKRLAALLSRQPAYRIMRISLAGVARGGVDSRARGPYIFTLAHVSSPSSPSSPSCSRCRRRRRFDDGGRRPSTKEEK